MKNKLPTDSASCGELRSVLCAPTRCPQQYLNAQSIRRNGGLERRTLQQARNLKHEHLRKSLLSRLQLPRINTCRALPSWSVVVVSMWWAIEPALWVLDRSLECRYIENVKRAMAIHRGPHSGNVDR